MTSPQIKKRTIGIVLLFFLFCLGAEPVLGLEVSVDLGAMVHETQKSSREPDKIILAWWIPQELWMLFLVKTKGVNEADRIRFLETLDPYTVMLVMEGAISESGTAKFKEKSDLRKHLRLVDIQGRTYNPIKEKLISKEAKKNLEKVGPFFVDTLGPVGVNAHFFLFPAKDANKRRIANALNEGTFVLKMEKNSFQWRTPLWPLVPPKYCPITGEELPGGWKFNPWNGAKLD